MVVLPFANLSDDREQQYFADGVTEDLTTDLSQLPGMLVISRNTAFTYKGKTVDAKQIGRELAVRYVLEGSVRRADNQVRINVQLIEAASNAHLWAERFDRATGDLFALQNEITSRIAIALNLALIRMQAARPTANPDALDYAFQARSAAAKPASREKYAEAISLYERALALDPRSVEAQSRLAMQLTARVLDEMTDTRATDIARSEELIGQALATSPHNPVAHFAKGQLLRVQRKCAEAITEYETVLAHNRNWVGALSQIARCKMFLGSVAEAFPLVEQAIRLSPRDPSDIYSFYELFGRAHLLQSRPDEAIVWFERSRGVADTAYPFVHSYLAAAYGLKGEIDHAAAELAEARRLGGEGFLSSIARLRAGSSYETPSARALVEATYYAGLRKAGVPEE
jgi:adenylate cyclase